MIFMWGNGTKKVKRKIMEVGTMDTDKEEHVLRRKVGVLKRTH